MLVKRIFDVVASASLLVVLGPIILFVALMVLLTIGRPILFRQRRPGRCGKGFMLNKFRTMTSEVDDRGNLLPDGERLTRFGDFLRRTSLDELPQLWNVLVGDMSFVGPRPLLMRYLPRYSEAQARRHEVRPGITGWAQIHGRRALDGDWDEKLRLDVWYVDNRSFWLDCKILMLTVVNVFRQEGIRQQGRATSDEFRGSMDDISG